MEGLLDLEVGRDGGGRVGSSLLSASWKGLRGQGHGWGAGGVGLVQGASERNRVSTQNDPELAEGEGHRGGWAWEPSVLESPTEGQAWFSWSPTPIPTNIQGPERACTKERPIPHISTQHTIGVHASKSALLSLLLHCFTGTTVTQASWKCTGGWEQGRGPGVGVE